MTSVKIVIVGCILLIVGTIWALSSYYQVLNIQVIHGLADGMGWGQQTFILFTMYTIVGAIIAISGLIVLIVGAKMSTRSNGS